MAETLGGATREAEGVTCDVVDSVVCSVGTLTVETSLRERRGETTNTIAITCIGDGHLLRADLLRVARSNWSQVFAGQNIGVKQVSDHPAQSST